MSDRSAPSQENLSGPGVADGHDPSPMGVKIYNNCMVNNVGRVDNANFGDNHGNIKGGSDSPQPAASSQFDSDTGELLQHQHA
ncbi:hypothetical protein EST38_g13709 [Candolleomyces aberdarensis]|uniref:Uncharacterized protein n=1 Tax=Candolleomyces aberdarensis TaxID=2316362 RepID=A0A4Q2D134_9AGAR|nr:hypothetical protein EST38_g13709 [Candolleomyces aberdarensis]